MSEYISMVYLDDERYLIDRPAYHFLCRLQEHKPKISVLKAIIAIFIENGAALKLSKRIHHLLFTLDKNCVEG